MYSKEDVPCVLTIIAGSIWNFNDCLPKSKMPPEFLKKKLLWCWICVILKEKCKGDPRMKHTVFGIHNGTEVLKYTLVNGGMEADIMTYGGTLIALRVPVASGEIKNVVFGYETLEDYKSHTVFMGALIGRFGNRIGNSRFVLNGKEYIVGSNEGKHSLHGGIEGFDKKIWSAKPLADNCLQLSYLSVDGEEGYPGNLQVTVTYTLTEDMGLEIAYEAVSDADTVVNLTNHAYFNVGGIENTTDGMKLMIAADRITPVDSELIPHNEFMDVTGTLFDFRTAREFICDLSQNETLRKRGCYDENFALNGSGTRKVAEIYSPITGLAMEVISDQPGMQIYTGNPGGIAMETQNFPNAVNCPDYPSAVLTAEDKYQTKTTYRFTER